MRVSFSTASRAEFMPVEPASAKKVLMNHVGVITQDCPERYLATESVNVCAGLALVSPDENFALLTHLYSAEQHFRHGRAAIAHHAQKAWRFIDALLGDKSDLHAVAFGGRDTLATATIPKDRCAHIVAASQTLNDAFFTAAQKSGRLAELQDLRYKNMALDAVIDTYKKKILIAPYMSGLTDRLHTQQATGQGDHYFDYSDPRDIIFRGWDIG